MQPSEAPEHLWGVWKRAFITAPPDYRDDTTDVRPCSRSRAQITPHHTPQLPAQVFWLQTKTLFGDVRLRAGTHEGLPSSLEQCDEAACAKLATQRASAGVIELTEGQSICQWHSDLEYQPLGGPPDIGRLKLESKHQARYTCCVFKAEQPALCSKTGCLRAANRDRDHSRVPGGLAPAANLPRRDLRLPPERRRRAHWRAAHCRAALHVRRRPAPAAGCHR